VYRYWGRPLLLVQVNVENSRIRIFYVFTYLMMDSNAMCLTVSIFSFLPQIWIKQVSWWLIFVHKWEVCHISHGQSNIFESCDIPVWHTKYNDSNIWIMLHPCLTNKTMIQIFESCYIPVWQTRSNSRYSLK
jgi:hypothetical protein